MKKLLLIAGVLFSANYLLAINDIKFEITNKAPQEALVEIRARDYSLLASEPIQSKQTGTFKLTDEDARAYDKTTGYIIAMTKPNDTAKLITDASDIQLTKKWLNAHKVTIDADGKINLVS